MSQDGFHLVGTSFTCVEAIPLEIVLISKLPQLFCFYAPYSSKKPVHLGHLDSLLGCQIDQSLNPSFSTNE